MQHQIEELEAEHRRQFVRLPVNICRCTADGELTMVSQELASLLGYDTPEALETVHLATDVFESGDQLRWLIDLCLASLGSESIETSWKRRDGSRMIVGVAAFATSANEIDLVVHDITTLRVLEERLRRAQRMEAVARYASEVAVTCDSLFTSVTREGQEWLSSIDSDTARYQGELLLAEVARASGLLRQLVDYGNEQRNVPEQTELRQMLRNLEPMLKHIAGDHVELVLPGLSAPITLDVDADRAERMLVNIAAYGRERMRQGGRLTIEVAPATLDRAFAAKHPNVRPGAHALVTVRAASADARHDASADSIGQTAGMPRTAPASDHSGVDIGSLQALVSECGGHLWIAVEPQGDMVLKIHLPRRALDGEEAAAPVHEPRRAGWISRLTGARH
jgi:signal transduction histidine kinase